MARPGLVPALRLRVGNSPNPRLRVEPFRRAVHSTLLQDMVPSIGALRSRSARVTDRYAAIRFGCVVLVEQCGNVQTLR